MWRKREIEKGKCREKWITGNLEEERVKLEISKKRNKKKWKSMTFFQVLENNLDI